MKSTALLAFALALSPSLAAAQQSPPADSQVSSWPHPSAAAMEQMHAQLEQIHKEARVRTLDSLTPAHRTLLASVAGQLAIAANPDRTAAARTLDAALSPSEARSVLGVQASARTQEHSLMESFRAQYEASLTPQQRAEMQQRMAAHQADRTREARPRPAQDAGMELLRLATGEDHHGFGHGGPPPMGGPGPA